MTTLSILFLEVLYNFWALNKLRNIRRFSSKIEIIQTSSPDSFSFLECKNKKEFEIFKKLYKYDLLGSDKWNFKASAEFHMTNNSKLFHTTNIGYPLYEGKMINMFTHEFSTPRYWIDVEEGRNVLKNKESNRMKKINRNHNVKPQIDSDEYRLAWRSITNSTNERTLISTILPKYVFLGNSLNYMNPISFDGKKYVYSISNREMFFICGIFNSLPIDFILRHKVATNLNIFYLMELPIPRYDENNPIHKHIMENSAKLICTAQQYDDLAHKVDVNNPVNDPEQRTSLEAQNNALVAKTYNLTRDDLKFILQNFPIVNTKLKELTLFEFDN